MSKLPSMPFFPADFFADTQHLTRCAAHGYLFLLGHAWLRGAKLPNDDIALARMAGMRLDQWRKAKPGIMEFWELGPDGYLTNTRLTKEWLYVCAVCKIKKLNGARGGRPKSLKSQDAEKPDAKHPHLHLHLHKEDLKPIATQLSKKPKNPRTQIGEDEQPVEADLEFARKTGMDSRRIREEWDQFRDHHRQRGNAMADWRAAWRTWVRNFHKFAARAAPSHGRSNGNEGFVRSVLEDIENDRRRREESTAKIVPMLQRER